MIIKLNNDKSRGSMKIQKQIKQTYSKIKKLIIMVVFSLLYLPPLLVFTVVLILLLGLKILFDNLQDKHK